jgi:antibiotic biosynthesis monooxygenase (ABM) superfamily enzyme
MKSLTGSQPAEASPAPVTYVVVWRVNDGKVKEFENLLHNLMTAAATFPGHQGVHVVKPAEGQPAVYRVVARFDSDASFQSWRESAVCRQLVLAAHALAINKPNLESRSGLEAWFQDPVSSNATPARYKTAVLMWAVLFPLTLLFRWLFLVFDVAFSPLAQTGMMMAFEIVLVTYVLMPQVAHLFGFWLYPKAGARA